MAFDVVFLARGIGGGLPALERFLASYRKHPAGADHRLTVLMKGWDGIDGMDQARVLVDDAGGQVLDLPDDGFDWAAYSRAAAQLDGKGFCALNTHSAIQHAGWLKRLADAAGKPGIGAAGCTGSWGTMYPMRSFIAPVARVFAHAYGWPVGAAAFIAGHGLVTLLHRTQRGGFPRFPNPHLRSNAFFMQRELFLDFMATRPPIITKFDAYDCESGYDGMTRFLERRVLEVCVVGKTGEPWRRARWMKSDTFLAGEQGNLMISDNQTRAYDTTHSHMRHIKEVLAWGQKLTP